MNKTAVNDIFSISRFIRLCWVGMRKDYRSLAVKTGGVMGFFLLSSLLSGFQRQTQYYFASYAGLFMVLGLLLSAGSFRDYYRRDRNAFYLTVPASTLEKWLEKFLGATLGWMVFSFIGFTVYTLLAAGLNELVFGFHTSPFWWQKDILWLYLHYLVAQSVFFLGGAVFRKIAFFKTILGLFVLVMFLGFLFLIVGKIVFPEELISVLGISRTGGGAAFNLNNSRIPMELASWGETLGRYAKVFYWSLIAPFCWLVSGIRFKEIEVKDGI